MQETRMANIDVQGTEARHGWRFKVTVADGKGQSVHDVALTRPDYERLVGREVLPAELVRESFAFLLEREPREAILAQFNLPVIGRYFPEFESEIRERLARRD